MKRVGVVSYRTPYSNNTWLMIFGTQNEDTISWSRLGIDFSPYHPGAGSLIELSYQLGSKCLWSFKVHNRLICTF